jgi:hypothetical protein
LPQALIYKVFFSMKFADMVDYFAGSLGFLPRFCAPAERIFTKWPAGRDADGWRYHPGGPVR